MEDSSSRPNSEYYSEEVNSEQQKSDTPPAGQKPNPAAKREDTEAAGERGSRSGPWLLVFIAAAVLLLITQFQGVKGSYVNYAFLLDQIEDGNVKTAEIDGNRIVGKWKKIPKLPGDDAKELEPDFNSVIDPRLEERGTLLTKLRENDIESLNIVDNTVSLGTQMLIWVCGLMLVMFVFFFLMRRSSDPMGSGGMFGNFARSPAREFRPSDKRTTFDDVAGMEQAKSELQEVVEFLKNSAKFQRLGAEIPKGVLLMGSPGTGKTLMARATAGEAEVPFFTVNGSEFIQMFVGVGASRVRDLFRTAKESAPCIIFIDEIDAVGRVRGAGMGGGHDEREQTLNQILSEMDGFNQNEAVIVIAATNRPDVLDSALTRPGRFDRHIVVDLPSRAGREGILKVHCRKVPLADDVNLATIAASTIGFSGAQLKNLVNEAALTAARTTKSAVTMDDFESAADRIQMGVAREETLNELEKEMTAYHEAGHALIAWLLPELDPVHKVTIIPRGRALGVTHLQPEEERHSIGERRLHSQLAMMLGGRAAEKMIYDEFSANAQDDLKRATDLARRMVAYWGMSETVGPVAFHHAHEDPFLGRDYQEQRDFSDVTAHVIDEEIQKILDAAAKRAFEILEDNRGLLDELTKELVKAELLNREEITKILGERAKEKSRQVLASSDNGQPNGDTPGEESASDDSSDHNE